MCALALYERPIKREAKLEAVRRDRTIPPANLDIPFPSRAKNLHMHDPIIQGAHAPGVSVSAACRNVSFRGAQAASLQLSAACRQSSEPHCMQNISAGCRDEQANGLCSPDNDFPSI